VGRRTVLRTVNLVPEAERGKGRDGRGEKEATRGCRPEPAEYFTRRLGDGREERQRFGPDKAIIMRQTGKGRAD
jgi:hypothetical protein